MGSRSKHANSRLVGSERGTKWMVDRLLSAVNDAHRLFAGLQNAAWAHGVTIDALRALENMGPTRPQAGHVLDIAYEKVPGQVFYRMKVDDESYGAQSLCVFFASLMPRPKDECPGYAGRVVVLGFCWWRERNRECYESRARRRYEHYVRKKR